MTTIRRPAPPSGRRSKAPPCENHGHEPEKRERRRRGRQRDRPQLGKTVEAGSARSAETLPRVPNRRMRTWKRLLLALVPVPVQREADARKQSDGREQSLERSEAV